MKKDSRVIRGITLFLIFLLMIGFTIAFPPSALDGESRSPGGSALTVAGQSRQCSQYPDETGVFIGAKTITSKSLPALVNVYYVTSSGGWQYYNEFTAPVSFSGGNRQYAYEVYYCPQQDTVCTSGATRAVTETSYQTCSSGQWSTEKKCSSGTYFRQASGACVVYQCKEAWTCGGWGSCTDGGQQYRTCNDNNACGTSNDKPSSAQSCTPTVSTGGTVGAIRNGISIIGNPILDAYEGKPGEVRTVTQKFKVTTPGSYWIEAGVEQYRGLSIADVEQNTCNPDEPWYANELVSFSTSGEFTKTFKVTPTSNGEWVLHTAVVTGCAGEVVEQRNAVDRLIVNDGTGSSNAGQGQSVLTSGPVLIALVGLAVVVGGFLYWRKK
jgi:hypothetical protein